MATTTGGDGTPAEPLQGRPYPVLQTERLLMQFPPADAASRVRTYFQKNLQHLADTSPSRPEGFLTEAYWRSRLEENRREFKQGKSVRLFLFARDNPESTAIGTCSFTEFVRGPLQACYLGYGLDRECVGQGLMHEALQSAIRYVFDELGIHRIGANYRPTNQRSGNLLRRLGFVVEGYARDYLWLDGAWRDHVLTSLVNADAPSP